MPFRHTGRVHQVLSFLIMRYLVLSDIHANLGAFEAVLEAADQEYYDAVIFLGDVVGYGNRAEECVQLLKGLRPVVNLLGNHDALLLEPDASGQELRKVDSMVERVIKRHRSELSADSLAYLRSFSDSFEGVKWQAVHGGLREQWEYLDTLAQAQANAAWLSRDVCLFGHTHIPTVYAALHVQEGEMWRTVPLRSQRCGYRMAPSIRAFFNPGSVGQPRDGSPLASYGLFDTDQRVVEVRRVEYDVAGTQASMQQDEYPAPLIERLAHGY